MDKTKKAITIISIFLNVVLSSLLAIVILSMPKNQVPLTRVPGSFVSWDARTWKVLKTTAAGIRFRDSSLPHFSESDGEFRTWEDLLKVVDQDDPLYKYCLKKTPEK